MRLLLLLSAFLTAVAGLGATSSAVVRPASELSAVVAAKSHVLAPAAAEVRTGNKYALDRLSYSPVAQSVALAPRIELYADRLRL